MAKGNFGGYILEEAYQSVYFIHPKGTKMYRDFKQMFRWTNMKRDTTIMQTNILYVRQSKRSTLIETEVKAFGYTQMEMRSASMDFIMDSLTLAP